MLFCVCGVGVGVRDGMEGKITVDITLLVNHTYLFTKPSTSVTYYTIIMLVLLMNLLMNKEFFTSYVYLHF